MHRSVACRESRQPACSRARRVEHAHADQAQVLDVMLQGSSRRKNASKCSSAVNFSPGEGRPWPGGILVQLPPICETGNPMKYPLALPGTAGPSRLCSLYGCSHLNMIELCRQAHSLRPLSIHTVSQAASSAGPNTMHA